MKKLFKQLSMAFMFSLFSVSAFADELFVFIHNPQSYEVCKGYERAENLPKVLQEKFGHIDEFVTASPLMAKLDEGKLVKNFHASSNSKDRKVEFYKYKGDMVIKLQKHQYENKTVLISWDDNKEAGSIVKALVGKYSPEEAKKVPIWNKDDMDNIYVVRVFTVGEKKIATFELEKQNLVPSGCEK